MKGCKSRILMTIAAALCIWFAAGKAQAAYMKLHDFDGTDGRWSQRNELTFAGGKLYGMTTAGGGMMTGTVFSMNTDGSDFQLLHTFDFPGAEGQSPESKLVVVANTIYGTARAGGIGNNGVYFSMNTDGTGYQVLRYFDAGAGSLPYGPLVVSGNTFYGITSNGGDSNAGVIYSMETDGSNYTVLRHFDGIDGLTPVGAMQLSGNTLYGVTSSGGGWGKGVVYSVNTDGSGYILLHAFDGTASDGSMPSSGLTLVGNKLYGTTAMGGASDMGIIYSIKTDGTDFQLLHSFSGANGGFPWAELVLSGGKLYGVAPMGGVNDKGVLFSIGTSGSGYTVLYNFNEADGHQPAASMILQGNKLYGITTLGGDNNFGVVYSYNLTPQPAAVPEPGTFALALFGGAVIAGLQWKRRRAQ